MRTAAEEMNAENQLRNWCLLTEVVTLRAKHVEDCGRVSLGELLSNSRRRDVQKLRGLVYCRMAELGHSWVRIGLLFGVRADTVKDTVQAIRKRSP